MELFAGNVIFLLFFFPLFIFLIGLWGVLVLLFNLIMLLVSVELLLLAANLSFVLGAFFLDDIMGQLYSLYIIAVAGAESAIGLAILVSFYRMQQVISIDLISLLKG